MEPLTLGAAAEIIKQGILGIICVILGIGYWLKDKELQACREQSRSDAIKMALALEQAAKVISESTEVERQRIETDKVNAEVMKAQIKQQDVSDQRAKDRADGIEVRLDGIVAKIEAMLSRMMGGRRGSA